MTIYRKGNPEDEAALVKSAMETMDAKNKRAAKTPESKKLPNSATVFIQRNADGKTTAEYINSKAKTIPYEGPVSSLNNLQWTKIQKMTEGDKRSESQF